MDGLLFDTEELYFEAMCGVTATDGRLLSREIYLTTAGFTWECTHARLRQHFGETFPAEEFCERTRLSFNELADTRLRLKGGMVEILDLLDELRLPRAIATSSMRSSVDHHLSAYQLRGRFDAVVAQGGYLHGKPHPAPYLSAAARLGVEPADCLALDDSINGVRSTAAAGMMTVMIPDLLLPTDEVHEAGALVAESLHDVHRLLAP